MIARRFALIGGGPTAVTTMAALLRHGTPASITIVDPRDIALGVTFGSMCSGDPELICNASCGVMYLDESKPNEFADYLIDRGWPVGTNDYAPRYLFGEFVRDTYLRLRDEAAARGVQIRHVRAKATSVQEVADGHLVHLDSAEPVHATDVMLCLGIGEQPSLPRELTVHAGHARLIANPYPVSQLRDLPTGAQVLVIGMRSTGVDATQALCGAGHHVTLTSSSGRFSAVRDRFVIPASNPFDVEELSRVDWMGPDFEARVLDLIRAAVVRAGGGLPLGEQVSPPGDVIDRLRAEFELASNAKTRWADLSYDIIFTINDIASMMPRTVRDQLLARAYGLMTRYINALPALMAERMLGYIDAGLLSVKSHYIDGVDPDDDGWLVTWRDKTTERFDYVVSAGGFHFPRYIADSHGKVLLRDQGTIGEAEPLEIDDDLRIHVDGQARRIWAIGPSSNQKFPLAHIIWLASRQAELVAAQVENQQLVNA